MHIPLEAAHRILSTFGITKPTREYERWVKPDGFDHVDFHEVLYGSDFIFVLDWRAALEDELERIVHALGKLDVVMDFEIDDSDSRCGIAVVTVERRPATVRYSGNDDGTSWRAVITALQTIMPPQIEFREDVGNGESDTDAYAVLPVDEWQDLERDAGESLKLFFRPLSSPRPSPSTVSDPKGLVGLLRRLIRKRP
ncbi:hypothetical protein Pan44_09500 [Caulifigura coniformis]|uniref:Uncharacterized protein n=1 Tax=Caulifigura coniformis TaxID=2527983 RepID=A0A517S9Y2_9PLAN|nr:hypothetical protein [Caulifigura coniformis]QDT52937.1 hypothetical protein Pan44_09500 [Caulifigura coniformis]